MSGISGRHDRETCEPFDPRSVDRDPSPLPVPVMTQTLSCNRPFLSITSSSLRSHLGSQSIKTLHKDAHIDIASDELIAPSKITLGIGN
jgi:hypothetical protein